MSAGFAELCAATAFSFLRGASHPSDMVATALALGMAGLADAVFPPTDFAMLGRAMGARGARVEREDALEAALAEAVSSPGPFVLDVLIDADRPAPALGRNEGLRAAQAARHGHEGVSFPVVGP